MPYTLSSNSVAQWDRYKAPVETDCMRTFSRYIQLSGWRVNLCCIAEPKFDFTKKRCNGTSHFFFAFDTIWLMHEFPPDYAKVSLDYAKVFYSFDGYEPVD